MGNTSTLRRPDLQLSKLEVLRIEAEATSLPEIITYNSRVEFGDDQMPIARFFRFPFYKAVMSLD